MLSGPGTVPEEPGEQGGCGHVAWGLVQIGAGDEGQWSEQFLFPLGDLKECQTETNWFCSIARKL